jgi:hypothetical protein
MREMQVDKQLSLVGVIDRVIAFPRMFCGCVLIMNEITCRLSEDLRF